MSKKKRKRAERTLDRVKGGATKNRGLSPREEVFALQYAAHPNGTQAAIRAGYSKRSAQVTASRLLSKAMVQTRIASLRKKTEEKLHVSRERVVLEAQRLAFSSVRDFVLQKKPGVNPQFKNLKDIPPWAAAAISEIRIEKDGSVKFRLYPKTPAIELLAKLMGYMSGPEEGRKGAIEIPNDASVIIIGGSETEFVLACRRARGE